MDDVTRAMSKGGGVLVNVQEGGVFQFFRGRMTSRGQCPRGVPVNVQEWAVFQIDDVTRTMSKGGGGAPGVPPIQVQTPPPPPGWLATGLGTIVGYIYITCTNNTSLVLQYSSGSRGGGLGGLTPPSEVVFLFFLRVSI